MDTRLLTVFLEVVRSGGFAGAARNLGLDPSSVSRAIAVLEDDLGVRLFERTTRRVSLTEAGGEFAAKVGPVLAELEQARDDVRSHTAQPRGRLCVTASVAFGQICLMPLIPAFLDHYPEIDVELRFTDRNVDLVAERVDLGIRLGPSVEADVVAARLMTTRYRICASPRYLAAHGRPVEPHDLRDHRCLCFDLPDFRTRWLFRTASGTVQEVGVAPRLVVSSALALREAALSDLGPALLADWLIGSDLKAGRLVDLFPDREVTATSFDTAAWLLYPSRSFLPRKTRVMIDFLRNSLGPGPLA
jgi:DNA-binding transcriptional LysR family regulator